MEERSAGAVLFNDIGGARKYLLLKYPAGHWDFPKGNVEKGESEGQTVLREVNEETGLDDVKLIDGFRRRIEYFYRRERKPVHKEVVFLLAETKKDDVKLSFEHQAYRWFTFQEALKNVTYNNSRRILLQAQKYLEETTRRMRK
ncbi:MAG: NUDIX domain-containing protein [Thaumarchaeota archaeon]|nr:MAG: NUDIX domain-containing protein [Nitrososphaerota archaeon]